MSFDIAGGIASAAQAVSDNVMSVANAQATRAANKKSRDFSREMSLWAYNKDLEQWNRANEYNTPANQMARLRSAGLNPRLMYGQGTTGNTTVTSPHMEVPKGQFIPPQVKSSDWIGNYLDFTVRSKQVELLNEQVDAQTIENIRKVIGLSYDYGDTEQLDEFLPEKLRNPNHIGNIMRQTGYDNETPGMNKGFKDYSLENIRQRNELVKSQIGNTIASKEFKEKTTEYLDNKLKTLTEEGINVDRDNIYDRQLQKMFGDSASVGSNWGIQLLQLIKAALIVGK